MSTLYIKREATSTIYYYGAVMVIHYEPTPGHGLPEEFHTHQLVNQEYKEENNRIMWERW
jgi:hypothetical protein